MSQSLTAKSENGQITWRKVKGHFKTITEHKLLVMHYCFRIGLYRQGLMHDLSKYMPIEFLQGCRFYADGKASPNNNERDDKGYSEAWMHHKGRNRHHYEYWQDYAKREEMKQSGKLIQAVQMPRKYVAEMLMDRISASKNYNKENYTDHDPLLYFEKGKQGQVLMHPQTARELRGMLRILDQRGEEALICFVKKYYLKGYPIGKKDMK